MKLSVLTVPLQGVSADEAFKYLSSLGVEAVELGTGGYTNHNHCNPDILLNDESKIDDLKRSLDKYNLEISALSCHGNAVHPDKKIAAEYHDVFVKTCKLAKKLGVKTVVTFSGCPGDCPTSIRPNWVTISWPPEYGETLDYQWNEVCIPVWTELVRKAADCGIEQIALENHGMQLVYNPETLLRLRNAVGPMVGMNLDPSHLF
jgi:sugar phosphate isomerase/epimerase